MFKNIIIIILLVCFITIAVLYLWHPRTVVERVEVPKYITVVSKPAKPDTVKNSHGVFESIKEFNMELLHDGKKYGNVKSVVTVVSPSEILTIRDSVRTEINPAFINDMIKESCKSASRRSLQTGIIIGAAGTLLLTTTVLILAK